MDQFYTPEEFAIFMEGFEYAKKVNETKKSEDNPYEDPNLRNLWMNGFYEYFYQ